MIENMIMDHASACYPAESCGLVIETSAGLQYMPCVNIADQPTQSFEISPDDWLRAYTAGDIVALVHSHPNGSPILSECDRAGQRRTALPWWVVCGNEIFKFNNVPPLLGRQFEHGILDCLTLIRDAYHLAGIHIPDYSREDEWWKAGQDLYLAHLPENGFYPVSEALPGDVILICLGSDKANHAAIYCGNQYVLHHCSQRLSKRDAYGGFWLNYTHSIWRHKQWPQYGFMAICNDMAASSSSMY